MRIMQATFFEPLRWQEQSARVAVYNGGEELKVYYQVTAPKDLAAICQGRPVEELPRILSLLGPAHHIASAVALDRLFKVEPPPLAINMRRALLQTLVFSHHVRKLFFFLTSLEDPLADRHSAPRTLGQPRFLRHLFDEVMQCLSLAQEAAAILGGRSEHPLTAVAGGVGRYVKPQSYDRLAEIGDTCATFAVKLAEFFAGTLLGASEAVEGLPEVSLEPMLSLSMTDDADAALVLRDQAGKEIDRFTPDTVFDKVELFHEPWSYEPFACLKGKSRNVFDGNDADAFYFVGPLARLNRGLELSTPRAEEARRRFFESLGPVPHFSIAAAYRTLLVELIQAAEQMTELFDQEKLTGPATRTIPQEIGQQATGAIESPQGLIVHRYRVDERGMVQELDILDTAAQNNALRCRIARRAVEESMNRKRSQEETRKNIEASLLPF
jgi:F420-non-reducing hydrogenase large subunit